ncbi:MAG: SDR family oxidoreductase, partial [Nitrososphaeria archaeon]|nr:SDR family oxidoreductase [Nitrososphaeria archaeon]NIN52039.1 SDR family oxidoreductase [Nitrososphaeria archaeon]NIQ32500.1 SDR family oxidoreductase [Nitrososphaeria archaeon]
PYNIRVNAVSPGATEGGRMTRIMEYKAKLWGKNSDEVRQQYCNDTALKRFLQPQEIAAAVLFLVTDGTGITGQAISVDAGWDV